VRVEDAVAEILKREGVDTIVGYPYNHLIESGARVGIRPVITRQERTGIHMADAISRLSSGDRVGVTIMQLGAGVENSFGGVAQAYSESVPLVVLPGGYPRRAGFVPPSFNATLNFQHVTKSAEYVPLPELVPDALRRAFTTARNGRPGPALVEIPFDVYEAELGDRFEYTPSTRLRFGPDTASVDEVAAVLADSECPLIYAGQGIHYAKAWRQLRELAELLEAPVTTSISGKSAFPEDHPLSLGTAGRSRQKPLVDLLASADLIFGIGASFAETQYGIPIPRGKTIVHATLDPGDINKTVPADHALIGDAGLTLDSLLDALRDRNAGRGGLRAAELGRRIAESRVQWLSEWRPKLTDSSAPLSPYRVIAEMLNTLDVANTVITHDAGNPREQLSAFWRSTEPLTYLGWGKTTQLGYGLGLTLGAKLARPDRFCVNYWGDAAIGHTGTDLETAARESIPILSVVMNNFTMATELRYQPVSTSEYGATTTSGDYSALARALGLYSERVTSAEEIVPALQRARSRVEDGTPALLEFITQPEEEISYYELTGYGAYGGSTPAYGDLPTNEQKE
jgi:acetolactate synthase-1/2/3 large subunit